MLSYKDIKNSKVIDVYIKKADESLLALGYTEHSFAHVGMVAKRAGYILSELGYTEREQELVKIAGHLHDIGNIVNRVEHSQSGAVMAFRLLDKMGMDPEEIASIVTAIGNHDEGTGVPVSPMAAALIIADKSDVRRSRVRNFDVKNHDKHDNVNYSVEKSSLIISEDKSTICLSLDIDTEYSSVTEYFEIFLERMILCRKAAEALGLKFELSINGQSLM
ncbi:MAG: HD domain-containing protein [Ruminococcaceae bacterium]|nr:HD domain-containing protein [Oscillospiraceae bacterium]